MEAVIGIKWFEVKDQILINVGNDQQKLLESADKDGNTALHLAHSPDIFSIVTIYHSNSSTDFCGGGCNQ